MLKINKVLLLVLIVLAFSTAAFSLATCAMAYTGIVSFMDADTSPTSTPGPETRNYWGSVAFDYNYRTMFINADTGQSITTLTLVADPTQVPPGTVCNAALSKTTVKLYYSSNNKNFSLKSYTASKPDNNTYVLSGFTINTSTYKYIKIHCTLGNTDYKFVNYVSRMIPAIVEPASSYYQITSPLYGTLLGTEPGPGRALYWGYNVENEANTVRVWNRENAKKLGFAYDYPSELSLTANHSLVTQGKTNPDFVAYGIDTYRQIMGDPGEAYAALFNGMPAVFGSDGWTMDTRWLDEYYNRATARAATTDQWALWTGDEAWELYFTKAIPVASRTGYQQALDANTEITNNYGFGTYGMPDGDTDTNPFRRIAHRRWVNDKMTAHFQRVYNGVKAVNPNMIVQSPDFASAVPAGDIEAWAPYFDIFTMQSGNWDWCLPLKVGVGCDTKIVADLTGKQVWSAVGNTTHPYQPYQVSPEDVSERYSQVFRNGGKGLMVLAVEWFDRELSHYGYSNPPSWDAALQTTDVAVNMNQVVLPTADCAILYPSDTLLTQDWGQYNIGGRMEIRSAYTMLGPLCGSWFKFVSDRQVDRGAVNLGNYRVLYIPFAEYLRSSVVDAIENYVLGGGTVIVTDIDAFSWNINGTALTSRWETISGVRKGTARTSNLGVTTVANAWWTNPSTSWTVRNPCYNMTLLNGNVSQLAKFTSDNTAAVTIHNYGSGHVIRFASDPFGLQDWQAPFFTTTSSTLLPVFQAFQNSVVAVMNRDIWRFKLPALTPWQEPAGYCLTGNYMPDRNTLNSPKNLATGGSYTYSRPPTGIPDVGSGTTPILFTAGNLMDRMYGYQHRYIGNSVQREGTPEDYYVSWWDSAPVTVTFDLNAQYSLLEVSFIYHRFLPGVTVSGSNNNIDWTPLGSLAARPDTGDVPKAEVPLAGIYRYLKLDFANGFYLTLCEFEIFGGTPLYSENFESGTYGNSVSTLGWRITSGDVKMGNLGLPESAGWGNLCMNGGQNPFGINYAFYDFTAPITSGQISLSLDAYSVNYQGINGEFGLVKPEYTSSHPGIRWIGGLNSWMLAIPDGAYNWSYSGGGDQPVQLEIYVDLDIKNVWGAITDSLGRHESPVIPYSGPTSITGLGYYNYKPGTWWDCSADNIIVTR